MITAEFYLKEEQLCGVSVRGHAGFDEYGSDIVCAAVTSAVELTANAITEILGVDAFVGSYENEVRIMLPLESDEVPAVVFLKALRLHLALLSEDYKDNLQVTDMEV
jgi:uncharacterized protein YsxB (DUF464 family)